MKEKIIERLYLEKGFVSGEAISKEYGLSRTAIWKYVKALREDGYEIESRRVIWLKPDGSFENLKTEDYTRILKNELIK